MELLSGTIGSFTHWLEHHLEISYLVLFFGAYFETLIGTCFFIPGEIFFISGSVLAGAGVLSLPFVIIALMLGAAAGDTSSYFVGRRVGPSLFKEGRVVLSLENYRKGERLFAKYGTKAVFFARLLGPLSWVTPFLAGIYQVPYRSFLAYNIPGVVIGVGQFIIVGYLFGAHYGDFAPWFFARPVTLSIIVLALIALVFWRLHERGRKAREKQPEEAG